jgi:hypothetical protein
VTVAFGGTYSLFLVDSYDLSLKPTVELGFTTTGFANASGTKQICSWRKLEEAKTICGCF